MEIGIVKGAKPLYPAVVFDCSDRRRNLYKVVFPGIQDPDSPHIINCLNSYEKLPILLRGLLFEILKDFETLPFPVKSNSIVPSFVAKENNIDETECINSFLLLVRYQGEEFL